MNSPELLSAFEICPRKAHYSPWERGKISTTETLRRSLYRTLKAEDLAGAASWGQIAGEAVLDLAARPGIETTHPDVYTCAMNHACLSDLLATTIRKPEDKAWLLPDPDKNWTPACLMSPEGDKLRRLVIVSHWSDDRHYSECRNWYTLGEMAQYKLPMQLIVLIVGQERNGRRHSHWTKALIHTINKRDLRFRRRVGNTSGGFKDSWTEIWREDHDEISCETWLTAMLKDDVLRDLCFTIEMPALTPEQCRLYRDLARRKLDKIERMTTKPPLQLTGCDWPVKCQFLKCCHAIPEREPSEKLGFVQISPRTPVRQEDMSITIGT